jgi:L-histidine Nalpha-methyltransferase
MAFFRIKVSQVIMQISSFQNDVVSGLSAENKFLSSKYFYDERGSRIFQEIMKMDSYYLPACETEILTQQATQIVQELGLENLDVVELGAGDGSKSVLLLEAFVQSGVHIQYMPFDISAEILEDNVRNVHAKLPDVMVEPIAGDYFQTIRQLRDRDVPRLVMFMGSNIGNFRGDRGIEFIKFVNSYLREGDFLLLGADLKKHPSTILAAYADVGGITARFNLNLLRRINEELDADFDLAAFEHYATYDPISGAALSFLISLKKQRVNIRQVDLLVEFEKHEAIHMEVSQKYSLKDLKELGIKTGFSTAKHFLDGKAYFALSLFKK